VSDLLDLCTSNATWEVGPYAEVRVGEHVTRYVRRGTGSAVVLVGTDATTNPVVCPLIETLAPKHRLIVPQPPPTATDLGGWLRAFIEGIGLAEVALIAGQSSAHAATDLAASDDFTIRKLVVLPTAASNGNGIHASDRILWVDASWPPTDAVARIATFISDEAAA
jgi:hypothetical protein